MPLGARSTAESNIWGVIGEPLSAARNVCWRNAVGLTALPNATGDCGH